MALAHSPSIVRNGLILHLDAANIKSYPGSGTVWKDLSGNGRNYNMYGTVPFSSLGGGCWDFTGLEPGTSGTSPLGFTPAGSSPLTSTGSFTVSAIIRQTVDAGQTGLFSNAGGGDGMRFGPAGGGIYYLIGPTYNEGVIGSGISLNQWAVITAVYDRQSQLNVNPFVYAYINGVLAGSVLQSAQTAMNSGSPSIVRSACCSRFIGYLSNISVYNRALTSTEIQQNFNAVCGRYGL